MSSDLLEAEKRHVARAAAALVAEDSVVALGSGSTAHHAIEALAARFPGGGGLRCVASSRRSEELAREHALQIVPLEEVEAFDLMIDGADEVAPNLTLIKGGGGAHFREKLLARMSRELVIIVDHTKLVRRLGSRSPLPVEVVPFAVPFVARRLTVAGLMPTLRMSNATTPEGEPLPFVTDNGNSILDCRVPSNLTNEKAFDEEIRSCPGVVETGLFVGLARRVLVGLPDGKVEELRPRSVQPYTPAIPSILEETLRQASRDLPAPPAPKAPPATPARPAKRPASRRRRSAAALPAE
jgi:ribose 5-phosphate isomerase A